MSAIVPASPLLAALIGAVVVLALHALLAAWVILCWLGASILSLFASLRGHAIPLSAPARRLLAIVLVAMAILTHWQIGVLQTLTQVVVLLLAIKQLELESQRDAFQIVALALLAMGIAGFFRADLGLAFLLSGFFVAVLILLIWQPLADASEGRLALGWRKAAAVALLGLLMTFLVIPLALLFFLLIPRSSAPLMQWSPVHHQATVGFSPDMHPGSVGGISANQDIAFRAQIIPRPANAVGLYWQGAVLWHHAGERWLPNPPLPAQPAIEEDPGQTPGTVQHITLNPNQTDYLFGLTKPDRVSDIHDVFSFPDGTLRLRTPPSLPIRYTVLSRPAQPVHLRPEERNAALQLPADLDPRLLQIAQRFLDTGTSPEQRSGQMIDWLSQPPFRYSLQNPPAYPQGQNLAQFLSETRSGYCELYAAALATLLRLNDIPARVVVGYRGAEYNPLGDYWIVRQNRAHAWVEAWYAGRGWVLLDATPGLPVNPFHQQRAVSTHPSPALSASQRLSDWLQWQWNNLIINLTQEKQRQIWTALGERLSYPWQTEDPRQPGTAMDSRHLTAILAWLAWPVAMILILIALRYYRLHRRPQDPSAHFRHLATRRLLRATPGPLKLQQPGQEQQAWPWWQQRYPHDWQQVQRLYLAQRYGPRPNAGDDRRLRQLLRRLQQKKPP